MCNDEYLFYCSWYLHPLERAVFLSPLATFSHSFSHHLSIGATLLRIYRTLTLHSLSHSAVDMIRNPRNYLLMYVQR